MQKLQRKKLLYMQSFCIYKRTIIKKNGFFETMQDREQPVLWQVFNNFKTPNRADKNIFKFRIFIAKKVLCNFLNKDFNFNENKIVEIYKN